MTTSVSPVPTATDALLDLLLSEGVDRVFGNPGTTEAPLIRALSARKHPAYVLGLHENAVVAMADGYARASGRTSFVNLHAAGGLANGMIGILNALRSQTPMVVTAGQQDLRHLVQQPMLYGDHVAMAQGVAKSAEAVWRSDDLPVVMRRAFRRARTPPTGPVFVSIPMNLLEEPLECGVPEPGAVPVTGAAPDVRAAARILAAARSPAIVAGDRVGRGDAVRELTELAETLGAVVYPQPMADAVNADSEHRLTAPPLASDNAPIEEALRPHDVLLLAGVTIRSHHYQPGSAMPAAARLIQIDTDPEELGRNFPVEVGLLGPLAPTLVELNARLGTVPGAAERAARLGADLTASRQEWRARSRAMRAAAPMPARAAAQAIADAVPTSTAVVGEEITSGDAVRRALVTHTPGDYHHAVGGGLGWGIGAAVGVQMAQPARPVVAVVGDGSAMFGLQALWSLAHYDTPVVVVILDNAEYRGVRWGAPHDEVEKFIGVDIKQPNVDWVAMGSGFGVPSVRVADTADLGAALDEALRLRRPRIVTVPITDFAADRDG